MFRGVPYNLQVLRFRDGTSREEASSKTRYVRAHYAFVTLETGFQTPIPRVFLSPNRKSWVYNTLVTHLMR